MKYCFLLSSLIAINSFAQAQTGNVGIGTTTPGSKLTVNGSFAADYKTGTAVTIGDSDYYYAWNGTIAATITLPAAATVTPTKQGRLYHIKNTGTANLTLSATGSERMDNQSGAGVASITVVPGQIAVIICKNNSVADGTNTQWEVALVGSSQYMEPWNVQGTTTAATANNQPIYQNNVVSIGAQTPPLASMLYVNTAASNDFAVTTAKGNSLRTFMSPEIAAGAFNNISATGDAGMFFAGTNGSFISTPSDTRGLVFAPWALNSLGALGIKITESGNVGIGIDAPSGKLDVNGAVTFEQGSDITVTGTAVSMPGALQFSQYRLIGGPTGTFTITGPTTSYSPSGATASLKLGARLVIYNNTTQPGVLNGYTIPAKSALEFVWSNNTVSGWIAVKSAAPEAMFLVNGTIQNNILDGVSNGSAQTMTNFTIASNTISGASLNTTSDFITLPAGTYNINISLELAVNSGPCPASGFLINSYFLDLPNSSGLVRMHVSSTSTCGAANHSASWNTTVVLTAPTSWFLNLGRGSGGNYNGGINLINTHSRISIERKY